jgi:hypothetical protein
MTDEERDLELATCAYRMADAMMSARANAYANLARRDAAPPKTDPRPIRPTPRT